MRFTDRALAEALAVCDPLTPLRLTVDPARSGWLQRAVREASLLLEEQGMPHLARRLLSSGTSDPLAALRQLAGTVNIDLAARASTAPPVSAPGMRRGGPGATGNFPATSSIAGEQAFQISHCATIEPVVAEGLLFHYPIKDSRWFLRASDARDGSPVWEAQLESLRTPRPVCVADGTVFYVDNQSLLARSVWDGRLLPDRLQKHHQTLRAAPIFHRGHTVTSDENHLLVCDCNHNTVLTPPTSGHISSFAADGEYIFTGGTDSVFAHSLETKTTKWESLLTDIDRYVLAADGLIIVSGLRNLFACRQDSGEYLWDAAGHGGAGKPALAGGVLYTVDPGRILAARDPLTGRTLRKHQPFNNDVCGSISVSGDTLFVGDEEGYLWALDTITFETRWKFRTSTVNHSAPQIADGMLYFNDMANSIIALR